MKISLGGIAKSYALERAEALLVGRGFDDFLLVSGGQVYARGRRGGRPWQVGVRYHHILDLRTGWPAKGLRSATVLAADPTLADALSTAVMVLGRARGLAVAAGLGAEALVVDDRGAVGMTPGLEARLTLLHPPRPD